jgi:hypothetical protein
VATVNVEKRLFCALAGVAGLSLLAVAYLLGRASSGAERSAPRLDRADPASATVPAGTGAAVPMASAPTPPSADPAFAPLPSPSAPQSAFHAGPEPPAPFLPTPLPAPELAPPDDPERAAVAAYLDAVDAIQASGLAGSPESAATEMAVALARGDASGLDGLVREAEEARRRLLAISPPAACAAHHRETLGSFDDALGMLRALRDASASADPAASLASVATQATALRARAEALQREDRALRARAGRAP